jgi:hypothetical protein
MKYFINHLLSRCLLTLLILLVAPIVILVVFNRKDLLHLRHRFRGSLDVLLVSLLFDRRLALLRQDQFLLFIFSLFLLVLPDLFRRFD